MRKISILWARWTFWALGKSLLSFFSSLSFLPSPRPSTSLPYMPQSNPTHKIQVPSCLRVPPTTQPSTASSKKKSQSETKPPRSFSMNSLPLFPPGYTRLKLWEEPKSGKSHSSQGVAPYLLPTMPNSLPSSHLIRFPMTRTVPEKSPFLSLLHAHAHRKNMSPSFLLSLHQTQLIASCRSHAF